jgi:hypothetical protein
MPVLDRKPAENQGIPLSGDAENGNVIFFILIAVVLMAALSYVFTQGTRTGQENIGAQKAGLAASEILEISARLQNAVRQLQINGCRDQEISFENSVVSGYENAFAPADETCHVFAAHGANISWVRNIEPNLDSNHSGAPLYGEAYYPANLCVDGVGSNTGPDCDSDGDSGSEDIVMIYPYLNREICLAINERLNIPAPGGQPPSDNFFSSGLPQHDGTFADGQRIDSNTSDAQDLRGRSAACITTPGGGGVPGGTYHFYSVLLAR